MSEREETNIDTDSSLIPLQAGGAPIPIPVFVPTTGAVTSIDGMIGPGITFNTAAAVNGIAVSKASAANVVTFGITGVGTMAQRNAVAAVLDEANTDATDLATALVLLNSLKAKVNEYFAKARTANHITP